MKTVYALDQQKSSSDFHRRSLPHEKGMEKNKTKRKPAGSGASHSALVRACVQISKKRIGDYCKHKAWLILIDEMGS